MKRRINWLMLGAALLTLGLAGAATAQRATQEIDSPYIVYAKAGRVNYVAGSVTRQRTEGDLREMLAVRDNLEAGEVVRTGLYGRVEVLLNPGSYMRANSTAEFALLTNELDNLRLRLAKGSVLLEVMGPDELQMALSIETPQTTVTILKRGIYRLNVSATGTQVIVQKGRANVGSTLVKGGNQISVGNGTATLSKFDKKMRDGFDEWSFERSVTLAEINARITDSDLRNSLARANVNNSFGRLAGLWVYDPYRNCYTYLPYSRFSWSSPYGPNYYSGLDYNNFMQYCERRQTNPNPIVTPINPSAGRQGQVTVNNAPGGIIASPSGDRTPGPKGSNGGGNARGDNGTRGDSGETKAERRERSLLIKREPDFTGGGSFGGGDSSAGSSAGRPSSSSSSSSNSGTVTVAPAPAPVAAPSRSSDSSGSGPKKP